MISRIVVTEPILDRRENCVCPAFDLGSYPLAPSSGRVGNMLHCIYPDTSRCLYNATTGALGLDQDAGLCPATAPGGICAPADLGNYCLGPGSAVFNSTVLICTYPTASELASTTFYCDYTTGGILTVDRNANLCPITAPCPRPTSSISTQRATCTVTPTVTPTRSTTYAAATTAV